MLFITILLAVLLYAVIGCLVKKIMLLHGNHDIDSNIMATFWPIVGIANVIIIAICALYRVMDCAVDWLIATADTIRDRLPKK